jgi:hypothetical protein
MKILLADRLANNSYNLSTDSRYKLGKLLSRCSGLEVSYNGKVSRHQSLQNVHDYPDWSDFDYVLVYPQTPNLFGGAINRAQNYYLQQMAAYDGQKICLIDDVVRFPRCFAQGLKNRLPELARVIARAAHNENNWNFALSVSADLASLQDASSAALVAGKCIPVPPPYAWAYAPYTLESICNVSQYNGQPSIAACSYFGIHKPDRAARLIELFDDCNLVLGGTQKAGNSISLTDGKSVQLPVMLEHMRSCLATIMICSPSQVCRTSRLFESLQSTVCLMDAATCKRDWIGNEFADLADFLFVDGVVDTRHRLKELADCEFRMHILQQQEQLLESWKLSIEAELQTAANAIEGMLI